MKLQFTIWKNTKKDSEKNHPDYNISFINEKGGYIRAGGGWVKKSKTGESYISCSVDTEAQGFPTSLSDVEKENLRMIKEREIKAKEESAKKEEDFNIF